MKPNEREEFILLTKKALGETDPDRFVQVLMERDSYTVLLLDGDPGILEETTEECLLYETLILKRLEEERSKIMGRVENLSKSRRVLGTYAPKFPFPPMPAFIDRSG